jgi:murein L,D-transpeptidase YcbB/YkuD
VCADGVLSPTIARLAFGWLAVLAVAVWGGVRHADARAGTGAVSGSARDDSVASFLRNWSRTGTLSGLTWPRFPYYRDELTSVYSDVDWRPVWSDGGRPTADARAVLDLLRGAQERGLRPEDYDVPALQRRFDELSASERRGARDVAWFDLALSVGVLRHLSDVHIGRVNPRHLAVGINVERKKLDLARLIRDARERGRVAELVRDVEPTFVQYRNLKTILARYRTLAADSSLPALASPRVLRPGDSLESMAVLRRRLIAFGDLLREATGSGTDDRHYSGEVVAAVARFQERHGLAVDSVIGPGTLAALNVTPAKRARQLELALERIRWLPALDAGPFVVVNVPGFTLYAFDSLGPSGAPTLTMNVVVGSANVGRRTPLFERDMEYLVFRPYWVIPPGILSREILPAVRRSSTYLSRNDMELYRGSGDAGPAVPTTSANIARVGRSGIGVRQRPGPHNSLGLVKFIFPNDHNVYMHDTPATELFSRARRDFSHGCIRLEDPAGFAVWVLRDSVTWSAERVRHAMERGPNSRRVNLARPLPVVIYYATAVVRPTGVPAFYDDIYGHDARLERELAKGYPYRP